MADIIGVISTVEDDDYQGKAHKKVTLQTGQVLKVKYGREGALKEKWGMLIPGTAIKFVMRDYQGKPFVADIESIKDSLPPPKQAAPHSTAQVPAQDMPQPKRPSDPKNRAFALSYAKDIYVARIAAGKLDFKTSNILAVASIFSRWLDGDDSVKVEEN